MHRQCSAEGNKDFDLTLGNVKVKPQKSLSSGLGSKHATCDFSEQVFPSDVNGSDAMTSSGKKRKMNSEEVKESNIRNQKRAKILDGMNQKIVIAFKEARALKDTADRLKAEGLDREGTDLYFEAALKFLHVASLLEPKMTENGNFEEAADQSISTYYDTAKICGICAQDYEKCNKMAAAALAYKCMEVAFMKVVFIKHSTASKDQRDQSNLMKTVHSHKHILCLLNFARDMSNAVEASKKSFVAYSHARSYPKASYRGHYGISSVKRVLDFSFHDIDELLHLMRISMDGHQILH